MEDVPTADNASHQSLMSTVEAAFKALSVTPVTPVEIVLVSTCEIACTIYMHTSTGISVL